MAQTETLNVVLTRWLADEFIAPLGFARLVVDLKRLNGICSIQRMSEGPLGHWGPSLPTRMALAHQHRADSE
jgi:hypothetical protein